MMKGTTYLDDNTVDNKRADITIILTANDPNKERREIHYRNRPFYEKFFNLEPSRVEYREIFVGAYNCLSPYLDTADNGNKVFKSHEFPPEFRTNPIHSWLRTEFEIVDHFPKITSATITGAEDWKILDLSCHFIDLKVEDRSRGCLMLET